MFRFSTLDFTSVVVGLATVAALTTATSAAGAEKTEISLGQTVEWVLESNPDLTVASYSPKIALESVTSARGAFDTEFYVLATDGLTGSSSTAVTDLDGASNPQSLSQGGRVGLARQLAIGTSIDVNFRAFRSVTNSQYASYSPALNSALSVQVVQPLLRGFGPVNRQTIIVAALDADVSEEQLRSQVQTVVFGACQAYWNLVFRRQDLDVRQRAIDLAQQQLERNQEQVRLGSLAPVEMIQAEQAVALAEYQLIQARVAVDDAQDTLRGLLGMGGAGLGWDAELVPIDMPNSDITALDVESEISEAMKNAPEVRQAGLAVESRRVQTTGTLNQRLPQLDLYGAAGISGVGGSANEDYAGGVDSVEPISTADMASQMFGGDNYNWSLGLSLSVPLRNRAAIGQYNQASLLEMQAAAELRRAEQSAAVAVRQAVRQLEWAAKSLEAASTTRELSERQLEAEEKKFTMGTATNFQVLQFQRDLADARTQELRALVDLEVARASLEQSKGTLLKWLGVDLGYVGTSD